MQDQRGVTLTEVVLVGVLASIVMLALTGFYINSQGTWIDASSQAVTQREATLVLEAIASSVHEAASVDLGYSGCLILRDVAGNETARYWVATDGLLHKGEGNPSEDRGALATSRVNVFDFTGDSRLVKIRALELRSANGQSIRLSTNAAFYNQ